MTAARLLAEKVAEVVEETTAVVMTSSERRAVAKVLRDYGMVCRCRRGHR